MIRINLTAAAAAAAVASGGLLPAASADELRGTFASGKAPYFWIGGGGAQGAELDLVRAILRRAGYDITARAMSNNGVRASFATSPIDFAAGLQLTDLPGYCHTAVYMTYHNVAISKRARNVTLNKPEDLLRYRVAIRQYLYFDLKMNELSGVMPSAIPESFTEFTSQDEQIRFFFADRSDLIVLDRLIFDWYAKRLGFLPDQKSALEFHEIFPSGHGVRAVFRQKNLCALFDRNLAALIADGTYRAIWKAYGLDDVTDPTR